MNTSTAESRESPKVSQYLGPKEKILYAAKILISRKGPVNMTVRDICENTGVNVAAVNYYYGSKEALVKAALLELLEPVNAQRKLRLLAAAAAHPGPLPIDIILECFMRPLIEGEQDEDGGRLFVRAEQHLRTVPDSEFSRYASTYLGHYAQLFLDALSASLPALSRAEIIWRYESIRGSAIHLLGNCDPRSPKFSLLAGQHPMIDTRNDELVLRQILAVTTHALMAPPVWTGAETAG